MRFRFICVVVRAHVRVHAWMHGCMDMCMYGCLDVWMYEYACMYVSMHVCMSASTVPAEVREVRPPRRADLFFAPEGA